MVILKSIPSAATAIPDRVYVLRPLLEETSQPPPPREGGKETLPKAQAAPHSPLSLNHAALGAFLL